MDNQLNAQEPVSKQTPVITDPIPDELAVQQTPLVTDPEPVIPVSTIPKTSVINSEPIPPEPIVPVSTVPEAPVVPIINPEPIQPEPKIETAPEPNEYEQTINQYAASQQSETPIQETPAPTQPTLSDFGIVPRPPQNNIFKIIFIISLIVFILVATIFAFVYSKNQQTTTTESVTTTNTTPTSTPT